MKKKLSLLMVALIAVAAYAVHRAGEATTLIDYPTSMDGISISGTTVATTAKIHTNTDSKSCLQLKNGYTTDNAYNSNSINLSVDGGFKAGDVVTIAGFINTSDATKRGTVVLFIMDAENTITKLKTFTDFINGRSVPDDPVEESYTLEADADKLYLGRDGNTATNVYLIKVTRPASGSDSGDTNASEETILFTAAGEGTNPMVYSTDHLTFTFDKGSGSTAPAYNTNAGETRLYAKGSLKIAGGDGVEISKVVYNYTINPNNKGVTPTIDGVAGSTKAGTWDADNKTWTGADSEVVLTTSGTAGNVGFKSITVTFTASAVTVAKPTFSLEAGTYVGTQSVEIACATEGASIFYTLDGAEPTANSTAYTAAISISETKTLKAIAVKGNDVSQVASATYTILESVANTQATAMTVADAVALIDAKDAAVLAHADNKVYVKGKVSKVDSYNENYKSITYWISDDGTTEGQQFEVYSGKGLNGADFASIEDVEVGANVIVYGNIKKFNTTYEFDKNNVLASYTAPAPAAVTLWSSEEPVAMPSDWSGPAIQIAAEKLADANVGDILHVAVEGVTATDLWGAQVAPYDGAWHQLENGVPVGGGNVTDAAFVVTGDMLKLMKANGLQIFGAGYSTKKISLEPGVYTGSENSVWVGDVTLNWTQATVQKFHFINTDVKAGDIIKLTYESTGTPNIMLVYGWGETDKYGTFYDVPTAEYVVKEADVAILKDKGLIVNAAGIRLTQIELILPKPDTYVVAGQPADIFGTAWDATNENNTMTKNSDGTYSKTYTVDKAYSGVELKVVKNGSEWIGDASGNNVTFDLTGAGTFTVTINPTNNEVTVTGDIVQFPTTFEYTDVYAVGNGSGNWLNGKLWDQAAAENKMTKVSDGVFEITYQNVPAGGPYQVKFAFDGSWTYNFGGTFATFNEATDAVWDGGNIEFNLANAGDVTLRLDLTGFDFSTKQGAKFTITGGEDSYVVAGAVGEKDGGAKDFMFGTAWDATAEANKMTKNEDTGLYEKTFEGVAFEAAATISYKIVKNGSTWIPDGDNQTCEIPAAGTYNIVATFNPETKEATMTATAAGPQTIDVEIKNLAGGSSITAAITEAAKGGIVKNLTLSLKGGAYTVEAPIETAGNVSISGNGTIDASALAGDAFIVLNGTEEFAKKADGTDSDHKLVNSVKVSGVTVTGLTTAFIKDAQKTLLEELTVENCVIEMPAAGKNFIDFNGKGYVGNVKVSKSTIWAKGENTGFFAQYGSRPKNVDANLLQQFDVKNSTIVNIANGKNFCDLKQNGTAQNVYTIKNNIFTDCGKSGQTVVGFNKGQPSATPVWDVDGNTFMFDGASTNAAEVEKAGQKDGEDIVQNCVEGNPEFKDAANGDFTVGDQAPQQLTRTGDPRWLGIYKPEAVTAAIELTPLDGADLAMDLAEAYQEQGLAPAYITINLLPGGHYTVSQPMEINATINIIGDEANPATIDLNDCSGAMVQYSSTIAPAFTVNNLGFYEEPFNVVFKNIIFSRVKNQLFYANKQKYLVEYFTVDNCIAEYLGGSKTVFDFNGGGVVDNFTINNSTIYGNSNDGMKHEGALYSSQSGDKATAAGLTEQKFTITNSTLYNIANGKNVMNHRQNGQTWLTFTVKNNVIFNCGKKGQFCQGLNGGQDSENPMYYVHYNSFMWYADGVLADVDDTCGSKNPNVVTASWKNTYPESAVTDVFPKFFGTDEIGQYTNFFRGNFTVADGSVQKTNSVGDPRWLKSDNEYTDIQGISADKMMEGAWYTIQGVRVDQPTKGLYIHNGRKVVLK